MQQTYMYDARLPPPLNPTTFLCFSNLFVLAVSLRGLLFPLYE